MRVFTYVNGVLTIYRDGYVYEKSYPKPSCVYGENLYYEPTLKIEDGEPLANERFIELDKFIDDFDFSKIIKEEDIKRKNKLITEFRKSHTVTAVSGNRYATDKSALINIALKRDSVEDDYSGYWYEDWGYFKTNKAELNEIIIKANNELQAFIDKTFSE